MIRQLIDLVLPRECIGCGAAAGGAALCVRCVPTTRPRQAPAGGDLMVVAATTYGGPVRAALLRYKERGRRELVRVLGSLLGDAVRVLSRRTDVRADRVVLVPVPSTRAASAARGGDHVVRLARRAGPPLGMATVRALGFTRSVFDAAGLAAPERARNIATAMAARPPPPGLRCAAVIVDDIVTTGATLREAQRALEAAGWLVLGAATVAATDRRG